MHDDVRQRRIAGVLPQSAQVPVPDAPRPSNLEFPLCDHHHHTTGTAHAGTSSHLVKLTHSLACALTELSSSIFATLQGQLVTASTTRQTDLPNTTSLRTLPSGFQSPQVPRICDNGDLGFRRRSSFTSDIQHCRAGIDHFFD
jgi:hypothetical protein